MFVDETERKEFERRLERDGAIAGFEARLSVGTGREVYALISATRRLDDSGRLMHMQGVVHDITDRKRFESALIDAKNQAEFYCDIMSHDLNNAIQGLGGYLELASLAQDVNDVNEFLPAAQEQLNRASVLLRNVRRLSRMGSRQVECLSMDARKILDYCTRAVTRNHPVDVVKFDLLMPDGPVLVLAEEFLEDVFMNLLENAVKYDPHDVKVVDVAAMRVQVEDRTRWQFRFRARGPGVADRDKRTIFGRFERRALSEYGTGLGLSIVLKAAERCGGTAWVEDRIPGDYTMGACFVVELPEGVTAAEQRPAGDGEGGAAASGQPI
jgi:signal transduction histidine kinase